MDPEQTYLTQETRLYEREFSIEERQKLAKSGAAMPNGKFPIETAADLEHAVKLWGHSTDPKEAKDHIIARAKALGIEDKLPYSWHSKGTSFAELAASDTSTPQGQRISEATAADATTVDPDRHILEVTLLRPGRSKMGNVYPPTAIRDSAHLFEGARAFVDHAHPMGLPERSVRDLVGSYKHVKIDEAGRLRGELHLVPGNQWLFNLLREAENNPDLCGLSIDAWCHQDPRTKEVSAVHKVESVDIVTRPSAGGQVNRVVQSDRSPFTTTELNTMEPNQQQGGAAATPNGAGTQTQAPPVCRGESHSPDTQEAQTPDLAKIVESLIADRQRQNDELTRITQLLAGGSTPPDPKTEAAQLVEELRREKEAVVRDRELATYSALVEAKLREAALPEPVTAKLRKQLAGRVMEANLLDDAISAERDTLAALASAGQIHGMGYEKAVTLGMSELDQLQAAFDKLFDIQESDSAAKVPPFSGIREAFYAATGTDIYQNGGADRPLRSHIAQQLAAKARAGHLSEAETHIREADTTTASFSYLLGTSMNKRLMKDYQAWPSEWQKFTSIVSVKDFKQQDRIRLGAFGSLSTVAEDAAYTTISLADTRAIYTPTKRGNLVQITRETIINDDLYAIKQIPQKLAVAAAFTLAEFVYNLLAPNFGNIYDAHPLFDSINHKNTAVLAANLGVANSGAALSSAALQTAVINMRKQQNLANKPIGLKPRFLLTVPDLEFSAMTILKSAGLPGGSNNDINPMMGYAEPIIAPQLNNLAAGPASTSVWIAVADPRVIDTLEVGFVGGQANPVLLIQDMPLYGLNFTQDVISYKVRHEYGGAVVDYRGFYLGNN